jgi:predicted ATP-grasp superfamily ATP-dependent carboligase
VSRGRAPAFDVDVPVLVLKIGRYDLHHGSVGIVRSLGRVGVPVYGIHEDRFAPMALSRYLCGGFVWPTTGDESDLVDHLLRIGRRLARPAILVPTDDEGAILMAEHAEMLQEWFQFPQQPSTLPRSVASKRSLYQICKRLGVPCPEAVFPTTENDVLRFVERASFPVVVKGIEPWLLARRTGLKSTLVVRTPEELLELADLLHDRPGGQVMFQEYIPEDVAEDWIVHGYCDAESSCRAAFTGVKLRSYPPYAGLTTLGRCAANPLLLGEAQALFKKLSYRGIMDMDWRLDKRDGQYKLLDFNPRIGAQFRMFEDCHGIDVVRALHLDLTAREIPPIRQIEGRSFVVEHLDCLAAWGYRNCGTLTLRQWRASLRGIQERAWFAGDDLLPFLVLCVRFTLRGIRRIVPLPKVLWRALPSTRPPRYVPGRRRNRGRLLTLATAASRLLSRGRVPAGTSRPGPSSEP